MRELAEVMIKARIHGYLPKIAHDFIRNKPSV